MTSQLLLTIAPWAAIAILDTYASWGSWPRPAGWQLALEFLLLIFAGRTQFKLARGWLRTPLLASAVTLFFSSFLYIPNESHQIVAFLGGVAFLLFFGTRWIATRVTVPPVVGIVVGIAVVLGVRYCDAIAEERPHLSSLQSTIQDLTWPSREIPKQPTTDKLPVVIITVDTLRADSAQTMETYKRLSRRGATWERAMSTSNWTLPALASLQTGKMPAAHGAGCLPGDHCQGISEGVRMLAEDLSAQGYATAAVVANPWLTTGTGFGRGFDQLIEVGSYVKRLLFASFPDGPHRQDSSYVIDASLHWLAKQKDTGFYLWVHIVDPHLPYPRSEDPYLQVLKVEQVRNSTPRTEAQKKAIKAAYAEEVAYADRQLLRLLDALEAKGVLDRGLVIFSADHGEEFWDHDGFEHGHSHHTEVVDVPLVLVAPGVQPGTRPGVASLLDVAPTIRAAVGVEPGGIDLRAGVPADRIATAWGGLLMHLDCSARDPGKRAIATGCGEQATLFELTTDPDEHRPLPAPSDDPVAQAARKVVAPKQSNAAGVNREALRMLGYQQ